MLSQDRNFIFKRIIYIFLIVIIAAGYLSASELGYSAKVIYVYDGDTVKLSNGKKVRYIGIDTPEVYHKGEPPQPWAEEAKDFNKKLVYNKMVRLEFDEEKTDKYGRLLAYVFSGDTFVNAELVKQGYAKIFIISPNTKYAEDLLKLENQARRAKKGLWQN